MSTTDDSEQTSTQTAPVQLSDNALDINGDTTMVDYYSMSTSADTSKVRSGKDSPTKKWKVGDLCMAPYSDGRWYPAQVLQLKGEECRVIYTEYNEEEDVQLDDLLTPEEVKSAEEDAQAPTTDGGSATGSDVIFVKNADGERHNSTVEDDTANNYDDKIATVEPFMSPPLPSAFADIAKAATEKESLDNMLMSWYCNGYHTGYFEGMRAARENNSSA